MAKLGGSQENKYQSRDFFESTMGDYNNTKRAASDKADPSIKKKYSAYSRPIMFVQ
jgi:hypothetical protein